MIVWTRNGFREGRVIMAAILRMLEDAGDNVNINIQ